MKNFVLIILDGVGIGELPDATLYGDSGAATLQHICENINVALPNLESLGLGKIENLKGFNSKKPTVGAYGKLGSMAKGKDTTIGHWELMGLISEIPFSTFPKGFPIELIKKLELLSGIQFIGNYAASGTDIIRDLGLLHLQEQKPIIYTSSDSVLQIAAHEDAFPINELYSICQLARLVANDHNILRVIARPFTGDPGAFSRTPKRKDFSMPPPGSTVLDILVENSVQTIGIGKIYDIFAGKGVSKKIISKGNKDCIRATIETNKNNSNSFIFTNLVDFDMLYGHRRDSLGFYNCLKDFDNAIPQIINSLHDEDILVLTADHGNDPFFKGTDHTREYVPLIVFSKKLNLGVSLGTGRSFSNVGKSVLEFFNLEKSFSKVSGESFMDSIFRLT